MQAASKQHTAADAIATPMVRGHGGTERFQADLVLKSGGVSDRIFSLQEGCTSIGRDGRCDVRIPLPRISPKHCEIVLENRQATLFSRDDTVGTLLNGTIVKEAPLAHDDEVQIGPVTFRVVLQNVLDAPADRPA
jgi:pSer/pThr/pTyr-binding forkhead associated (FHA) protein